MQLPSQNTSLLLKIIIKTSEHIFLFSRTAELRERIETVNGEIQQLDMDLEEHQG